MKKVGLVVNSRIKQKEAFYRSLQKVENTANLSMTSKETNTARSGITHAQAFAENGFDYVVAVGGDGTLNEVVNGVLNTPQFNGTVVYLPFGTANDFSKSIACPKTPAEMVAAIVVDKKQLIKAGKAEYHDENQTPETRYFINIADVGMGADVVNRVNGSAKYFGPDFAFMKAIVQTFFTYKNQPVSVNADGWQWAGSINSLVMASGKYFGSGLGVAPEALPTRDDFEIVIIGDISIKDYLLKLRTIKKCEKVKHPQVLYKKSKKIRVTGLQKPCALEADGEFFGYTPLTISIAEKQLSFLRME